MIWTEWVISSGWVMTIVVFAGKSIVSYSGLADIRSPRSSASVVGGGGAACELSGSVSALKFQSAPMKVSHRRWCRSVSTPAEASWAWSSRRRGLVPHRGEVKVDDIIGVRSQARVDVAVSNAGVRAVPLESRLVAESARALDRNVALSKTTPLGAVTTRWTKPCS